MGYHTYNEKIHIVRKEAKKHGLVLRAQNLYINGAQAYKLVDRESGETVYSNSWLSHLYDLAMHDGFGGMTS